MEDEMSRGDSPLSNSGSQIDCPIIPEEDAYIHEDPPYCWLRKKHHRIQQQAHNDYVMQRSPWNPNKLAHSILNLALPLIGSAFSFFNALYRAKNKAQELEKLQDEMQKKAKALNKFNTMEQPYSRLHFQLAELSDRYFYLKEKNYTPKLKHYGFDFIITLSTSFITTLWLLQKYTQFGLASAFVSNKFEYFIAITIITLVIRIFADIIYIQLSNRHAHVTVYENTLRQKITLFFKKLARGFFHGLFGEGAEINLTQPLNSKIETLGNIINYPPRAPLMKSKSDETFYSDSSLIDEEHQTPQKISKETHQQRIKRLQSQFLLENKDSASTTHLYNRTAVHQTERLIRYFGSLLPNDRAILALSKDQANKALSTTNRIKENSLEIKISPTDNVPPVSLTPSDGVVSEANGSRNTLRPQSAIFTLPRKKPHHSITQSTSAPTLNFIKIS